ncbi:hypothetical protein J4402_02375 [Candidatus Pacearchaeota archaeon]|nr:hypothetical protein [uncultured archaeon]AQS31906.1 hypothetical protein [uncultured archaeon]MBS3088604.1 hypothetical protein [Candidatus Pacearchaeota archaeon]
MISPRKFFETTDRFYHKFLRTDEATALNYARLYLSKTCPLGRVKLDKARAKFKAACEVLVDFHRYSAKDLKDKLRGAEE